MKPTQLPLPDIAVPDTGAMRAAASRLAAEQRRAQRQLDEATFLAALPEAVRDPEWSTPRRRVWRLSTGGRWTWRDSLDLAWAMHRADTGAMVAKVKRGTGWRVALFDRWKP